MGIIRTLIVWLFVIFVYFWGAYIGNKNMKAAALRAEVAQINEAGEFEFKRIIRFDKCNKDGSC